MVRPPDDTFSPTLSPEFTVGEDDPDAKDDQGEDDSRSPGPPNPDYRDFDEENNVWGT